MLYNKTAIFKSSLRTVGCFVTKEALAFSVNVASTKLKCDDYTKTTIMIHVMIESNY